MSRTLRNFVMLLACLPLITACEADEEEGPALPPAESMELDLGSFPSAAGPGKADHGVVADHSHVANAGLRVGLLNLAVWGHLVAPVTVFRVALAQRPTFADGVWTWDFEAEGAAGAKYQAVLTGWFEGNLQEGVELTLEMHVTCSTCSPALDNFKWYSGHFNNQELGGGWIFHSPEVATDTQEIIQVDYDVVDAAHRSLTFLNVRADDVETAGDEITYVRDGDLARETVHDADYEGAPLDYAVEWHISDGSGYIEVPGYNDGARACWDADQINTDCP